MRHSLNYGPLVHAAPLLMGLLADTSLGAQTSRTIPSTPACNSCSIEVRRIASLGNDSDPASARRFHVGVSRDSRGRYYVAPMADLAFIAVFDSTGRFLKQLGRRGKGPGEYQYVMMAHVGPNDSLYVLDEFNKRLTVLTPDHSVARIVPVRGTLTHGFPLPDGRFVAAGRFLTPERLGLPLHLLDSTGVVRSFGATDPSVRSNEFQAQLRQIALARKGGVWSARMDRYEVERWTLDGERVSHLAREAAWFPAWTEYSVRPPDIARPKPMLRAIWEDGEGRLWTVTEVAKDNWRAMRPDPGGEAKIPPLDVYERTTEAMIEVLDVERGQVIASTRVPAYIRGMVSPGVLHALRSTPEGDTRVDIWQVTLHGAR